MANLRTVNKMIAEQVHPDLFLVKGSGYFYVASDNNNVSLILSGSSMNTGIHGVGDQINSVPSEFWVRSVKDIWDNALETNKEIEASLKTAFMNSDAPDYPDSRTERSIRDNTLTERRDSYLTGPADIEFEQDNTLPGIDNPPIVDDEHSRSWRKELMGSIKTAANGNYILERNGNAVKIIFPGTDEGLREAEFASKSSLAYHVEFETEPTEVDEGWMITGTLWPSNQDEGFKKLKDFFPNATVRGASRRTAAKNSLNLLNVKKQTPKRLFDKETNLATVDRMAGDENIYGEDKPLNRNIRNERGKIASMVILKHLQKGDTVKIAGRIKRIESVETTGVIARDLMTSFDELYEGNSFFRTAAVSKLPNPVIEKPDYSHSDKKPFFATASVKEGEELFPDEDDTLAL